MIDLCLQLILATMLYVAQLFLNLASFLREQWNDCSWNWYERQDIGFLVI